LFWQADLSACGMIKVALPIEDAAIVDVVMMARRLAVRK
jgi:hypothetical protein